jgi:hypothetical protein
VTDTPNPETETDQPETEPEPETPPEPSEKDDRLPDDHPVVKALRKANKEAEEFRRRLKEIEDRDKPEDQRAAEKAAEAEKRADEAEAELARHKAAIRHGLTADDLELLDGVPADQVETRAERLAARIKAAEEPVVPASRNQGGGSAPSDVDPDRLAEDIWSQHRI